MPRQPLLPCFPGSVVGTNCLDDRRTVRQNCGNFQVGSTNQFGARLQHRGFSPIQQAVPELARQYQGRIVQVVNLQKLPKKLKMVSNYPNP